MSVKHHTTRLGNWLWYTGVSLLVLLAISLTAVRLLLPVAHDYRHAVEQQVSALIGQPVEINTLDARLLGLSPSLIIGGVTLLDQHRNTPLARFETVRIHLDLLASIVQQQLILDELTIVGAKLGVVRHTDGQFELQGMSLGRADAGEQGPIQLGRWLFSQGRVAIERGQLSWEDRRSGQLLSFSDVDIHLENRNDQHRLDLTVNRPGTVSQALNLAFFMQGNFDEQASWQGDIYIRASRFQPVEWLRQFSVPELTLNSAEVDLELWGHWQAQQLDNLEGSFSLSSLAGKHRDRGFALEKLAGLVRWKRTAEGWQTELADLILQEHATRVWEPLRLSVYRQKDAYHVLAERVDMASIGHLLQTMPVLDEKQQQLLAGLAPRGELRQLRVERSDNGVFLAQSLVKDSGIDEWEKIPGFDGLNGQVWWNGEGATARLESSKLTVNLLRLFRAPIELSRLDGRISLEPDSQGWYLSGRDLRLANPDLKAELSLDVALPTHGEPFIDIRGHFKDGYGPHTGRYLPVAIMHENLVEWLDQAIVKGRVVKGSLLFHGRPGDFPFTQSNGRFQIAFEGMGTELSYFEGWPHLTDVHADVVFEGNGMHIRSHSARILNSPVDNTEVIIRDFKNARLIINAEAELHDDDALYLLRESPLAVLGGSAAKGMLMEGENHVSLSLDIPLAKHLADEHPLQASGEITFLNSRLTLEQGLQLHDLQGVLGFSNEDFHANAIQATLLGGPVSLDVLSRDGNHAETLISASGRAMAEQLREEVEWEHMEYFSGETPWQMHMSIPHDTTRSATLSLQSDLVGTRVTLPDGLAKGPQTPAALSIDIALSGQRKISIKYADRLALTVDQGVGETSRVQRAAFHFGGGRATLPSTPSVRITGQLEQLHPADWLPLFQGEKQGIESLPVDIIMRRMHIAELPEHRGGEASQIEVDKLPDIKVVIDSLAIGEVDLGKVHLDSQGQPGYRSLSDIRIEARDFTLKGEGWWQRTGGSSLTHLALDLQSENVGNMLKSLGFRTMIDGGAGIAQGNISWPGSPFDFDLNGLNGNINFKNENGVIVDVDPGAGRLLGLFSLYELPRRLRLDFRDLFQKGMEFSLMEGNYLLREGNAYTRDFKTATPAATIVSVGRTGLVAKDFDQEIAVVPNVSGTLPIAGGLAWGPQVAAVLLVLQELLKPGIEEATMSRYHVTGSWESPSIEKITHQQQEPTP